MDTRRFFDRFEKANKKVAQKVRKNVQEDVDQRKFEEGKPLCFTLFHTFSSLLLPLDRYPEEFKHLYTEAIFDLDMKDDLERAKVINWCQGLRALYPIKTTANGNCLANAISLSLWGLEDSDAFLRRLLYVTMTTDPKGRFKRRWLNQQRTLPDITAFGLRLNTDQYTNEWEAVIRATTDVGNNENAGMPYTFLESIHLYIFANIIRRPIILLADKRARSLFGESIQESDIGGIFLPLEWDYGQCEKSPVVLGYNMNHFAPLISQEFATSEQSNVIGKAPVCPIITSELTSLKIQFLLPDEEFKVGHLLMQYMEIEEFVIKTSDGYMNVPCAKLTYKTLPDKKNIIQQHRKDCENKFRHQVDEEVGISPPDNEIREVDRQNPFYIQVMNQNDENMAIKSSRQSNKAKLTRPVQVGISRVDKRKRCSVVGCKMYGSPEFNDLCSKCFGDFTVQYARDEAASRRRQAERPPIIALETADPSSGYNDLSIMGENCQTGCGFRCSVETYPYCHECYPRYVNQTRSKEPQPEAEDVEISLMPEQCKDQNCQYRASKQTYPYCHECYDKYLPKAKPTAPPILYSEENTENRIQSNDVCEPNLKLRIEEEPETNLIEIREPNGLLYRPGEMPALSNSGVLKRNCKTGGCLNPAIRGNDGFCDKCYDHSLFGEGELQALDLPNSNRRSSVSCKTAGCKERPASGCDQCLECFLREGTLPCSAEVMQMQIEQEPPAGETSRTQCAENTDLQLKNDLKMNDITAKNRKPISLSRESVAVEEVGNLISPANLIPTSKDRTTNIDETNKTHRKYICAKPGCQGIRMNNSNGLCYDCYKTGHKKVEIQQSESGNNLDESAPFVSDTPFELSEEQKKELYPVIVSSKQKVKCVAPVCDNMIYPPAKLCEVCTAAIERDHAERMKSGDTKLTAPISSTRRKTDFEQQRRTAPVVRSPSKDPNALQRHTVPIAKARAKLCIEKDCERYGDPAQKDRCSRHYNLAVQQFRQPTPPLDETLARPFGNGNYNIPSQRRSETILPLNVPPEPVENGEKLTAAMSKIENSRKSRRKCKNQCGNYANPQKHGFCNNCYDNSSVQTLLGHPRLPGRNQIDYNI